MKSEYDMVPTNWRPKEFRSSLRTTKARSAKWPHCV